MGEGKPKAKGTKLLKVKPPGEIRKAITSRQQISWLTMVFGNLKNNVKGSTTDTFC